MCQRERNGLREDEVSVSDETLRLVVDEYTREAGVRNLERELGTVLRKTATKIASAQVEAPVEVKLGTVRDALGRQKFFQEAAVRTASRSRTTGASALPEAMAVAVLRRILPSSRSRLRMPASRVYSLTTVRRTSSPIATSSSRRPLRSR